MLDKNKAYINVIRKQAKIRITTAKAKGMEQTTARITSNCKRKF